MEALKSVVLALLVVVSLGLSARLWLAPEAPPAEAAATPIAFPGALPTVPDGLFAPSAAVVVQGQGRATGFTDPAAPGYAELWRRLGPILRGAPVEAVSAAEERPIAQASGEEAPTAHVPRLELVYPYPVPWSVWYGAATGAACTAGDGPPVDWAALWPDGADVRLAVGAGDSVREIAVAGAGQALKDLLASPPEAGRAAFRPLAPPDPWASLRPLWIRDDRADAPELAAVDEFIEEGPALPAAFFEDVGAVRRIDEEGGGVVYTDGRATLRSDADGRLQYDRVPAADRPVSSCTKDVLDSLASFVAAHGGWPGGAALWLSRPVYPRGAFAQGGAPAAVVGQFAEWAEGLPVVGPGGPIALAADGRGVEAYRRDVREIVGPVPEASAGPPLASPEAALRALAQAWPKLYPEGHAERRLGSVRLVYFAAPLGPGRATLRPAWSIRLLDGTEWSVDARSLAVLGTADWRP